MATILNNLPIIKIFKLSLTCKGISSISRILDKKKTLDQTIGINQIYQKWREMYTTKLVHKDDINTL